MKLTLNNIGKIKSASIDIEGITVIGGENNTGKSTISKALYSILNAIFDLNNTINNYRIYSLNKRFERFWLDNQKNYLFYFINKKPFEKDILEHLSSKVSFDEFKKYLNSNDFFIKISKEIKISDKELKELYLPFTISNEELITKLINKSISSEFGSQVCNINKSDASIELKLSRKIIRVQLEKNEVKKTSIKNNILSHINVVYFDNSIMVEQIFSDFYNYNEHSIESHYKKMWYLLNEKVSEDIIGEIIADNELKEILDIVNGVCPGKIIKNNNREFQYLSENNVTFSMENISAGLKTFAIIKTLLIKGALKKSDVLILDEPEIHLHPKWQIIFAKLIVLLNKKFDLKILINTHSPYFLEALDVNIAKYGLKSNKYKYYLSSIDNDGNAFFKDVSDSIDKIYALLAEPLQELENEKFSQN